MKREKREKKRKSKKHAKRMTSATSYDLLFNTIALSFVTKLQACVIDAQFFLKTIYMLRFALSVL